MQWNTNLLYAPPWATDEQYSVLPSPAVTLIAVCTYHDDPAHHIEIGVHRGDKIRILLSTPSADQIANSSVVMMIGDEVYAIGNREKALSWFDIGRLPENPLAILDADGTQWLEEVWL